MPPRMKGSSRSEKPAKAVGASHEHGCVLLVGLFADLKSLEFIMPRGPLIKWATTLDSFGKNDVLTETALLPGFEMPVADAFQW